MTAAAKQVWVIDDDQSIRWVLDRALKQAGMDVVTFEDGRSAKRKLTTTQPDVILSDVRMPGIDGMQLLADIQRDYPQLPVIIMTAYSDLDSAVSAYEGGAFEYLPKPFDVDVVIEQVNRAIASTEDSSAQVAAGDVVEEPEIIGKAPAMQEVFRAIGRLAKSSITVLITGESGTGKELVARALHRHSPRAEAPFIALNTAAIPKDLLESELFGHEKGAFTGAHSQRKGRFEQAEGGTLFLDEIGDMPMELQTRLLRVLSVGEYFRVGGHTALRTDVRVIAATHQDLEQRVVDGLFREDLLHRLNVIRVHVPALRERAEDITVLASRFLDQAARELNVERKILLPETEACLSELRWPGNVRQLENLCRWLSVMAAGDTVHISDLPVELKEPEDNGAAGSGVGRSGNWQLQLRSWVDGQLQAGGKGVLREALPLFEKVLLDAALQHTAGRKQDAAELLGWGRNTLTRKLKELGDSDG